MILLNPLPRSVPGQIGIRDRLPGLSGDGQGGGDRTITKPRKHKPSKNDPKPQTIQK